jgi:DNA-binding NtrC family response regulator
VSTRVLVVDDEPVIAKLLRDRLTREGHEVIVAGTGAEGVSRAEEGADLVLLDYGLPDTTGLDVLRRIKAHDPDTIVIMLTANAAVDRVVETMRAGAFHYATKPFNSDEIALLVEKALETTRLRRGLRAMRASRGGGPSLDSIIGDSPAMRATRALIARVATAPASTVLITGESGTGKDLAAKVIHELSDRAERPFMNITCSAMPETLLEPELFGHERGAFTDARQQKRGLLELADEGTVFLDEIGEMAPALQAKLLRFLEEKSFRRVGGSVDVRVDVRVVAATNRDLERAIKDGKFREDLYYRLNVLRIELPPLAARRSDLPLLLAHFIDVYNRQFQKSVGSPSPEVMAALEAYGWPGNVRELRNLVERAVLLSDGTAFDLQSLSLPAGLAPAMPAPMQAQVGHPRPISLDDRLRDVEAGLIRWALDASDGNKTRAAALLGIKRSTLGDRMARAGLS